MQAEARKARTGRVLIALAAVLVATAAPSWSARIDVPKPTGFVVDQAGVIDAATKRRIEAIDKELKDKTGAEIAVVTVRSTKPETPFDYAMAIAESWKPGARGKDNGVVFLIATEDREMYILTGYGTEGVLPDGRVGEIRDTIVVPAFRRGDYSGGILAATSEMASLIAKEYGVELTGAPPVRTGQRQRNGSSLGFPILVLILVLFSLGRSLMGRRFGGGRGRRGGFTDPFILGTILGSGRSHGGFGGGFGEGGGFGGFGGGGFGGGGAGGRW